MPDMNMDWPVLVAVEEELEPVLLEDDGHGVLSFAVRRR